jgi:D-alanyl-D-alanine carboxypeptidase/D-alanyl-D-alanine-endopeptidase (penicillin-binding protein 4)
VTAAVAVGALAICAASGAGTASRSAQLNGLSSFRTTAFEQRLSRALTVPDVSRSQTGAVAFDLRSGKVVFALNPALSLAPASNEKLSVTYTALVRLGPDFRFHTEVLGTGKQQGSTWDGDLYLHGGGDPTLKMAGLRLLAKRLYAQGIRRVSGDVVADESFFDSRRMGPGWKASFWLTESPPLSALVVARATYKRATTPDPAGAAAALFLDTLGHAGITVEGQSTWGTAPAGAVPLAQVESAPLSQVIAEMDSSSDNFTAEMLLKELGAQEVGSGTTAAGARVVDTTLAAAGVPLTGVRIADGSGLSPLDRLTAGAIGSILLASWQSPTVRPYVFGALAVAGRTGTLADRLGTAPTRGTIRAKTGTTDIASALSGYAGSRYLFAVVQDGSPISTWWARTAQDRFATVLAAAARTA